MIPASVSLYFSLFIYLVDCPVGYFLVGFVYFFLALYVTILLFRSFNPFDPLSTYIFGTAFAFGLGIVVPYIYPELSSDYFLSRNKFYREIHGVVFLNFFSVFVVILTSIITFQLYISISKQKLNTKNISKYYKVLLNQFVSNEKLLFYILICILVINFASKIFIGSYIFDKFNDLSFKLSLFLLFCVGYRFFSFNTASKFIAFAILFFWIFLGMLTLYKFNMLAPCAAFVCGLLYKNLFNFKSLVSIIIMLLIYVYFVQPIITIARTRNNFELMHSSYLNNLNSLIYSFENFSINNFGSKKYNLLNRFSHVKYQAYLINEYNNNHDGDSMNNFYLGLVPRFIYSDKPDITRFGREFYDIYTKKGLYKSSLAMTYNGEAYWNGGFLGLLIVSMVYGFEIGVLRVLLAKYILQKNRIIIILSPLIAFFGYSIESSFTAHKIGSFITLLIIILSFNYASKIIFNLFSYKTI